MTSVDWRLFHEQTVDSLVEAILTFESAEEIFLPHHIQHMPGSLTPPFLFNACGTLVNNPLSRAKPAKLNTRTYDLAANRYGWGRLAGSTFRCRALYLQFMPASLMRSCPRLVYRLLPAARLAISVALSPVATTQRTCRCVSTTAVVCLAKDPVSRHVRIGQGRGILGWANPASRAEWRSADRLQRA